MSSDNPTPTCIEEGCTNERGKTHGRRCSSCARLRFLYGVTTPERANLLKGQHGCCAICNSQIDFSANSLDTACLDHDHRTGKVRSILCGSCNLIIGRAESRATNSTNRNAAADWLMAAAEYIAFHNKRMEKL